MGKINFNVLMVEDNNGDAKLVSEMLKGYIPVSFKMSRTNCLEKTLKILKEEKFDIILLDLDLPDSHGLVTLGKIISMNYRIPIIVLTGFDDDDTGIKAMQMQAEDYLIKGYIDTNLLVRSIRYSIERKSVKEKLELSKQQYKSLAENVPSILIRYDKNLHIKYLSPKAETITGIPSNKFIGKANKEMGISEYLCVLWDNAIKDVFKIEHRKSLEFDFPSKNGLKTFYMTLSPEFSLKGIIDYVLCVLTDITERKHAEEILKRDVEIFERLVNERSQELAETLIELEKTKRLSEIGTLAATIAH
ncbi:response regulator, partial [Candidatus Desantisbacteria bacterium]|nr:response regulator [Candidatus Desantisbacteria bacterium]